MIYYIFAGKDMETYSKFLGPSIVDVDEKLIVPKLGTDNIFKKYNEALSSLDIKDDDVIVFSHDDITIKDPNFEEKIQMFFNYKTNVAVAGVMGTTIFVERGGWWYADRSYQTRGKIIQGNPNGPEHIMDERGGGMCDDVVSVDGCIMFIRGSVAKTYRFDEKTFGGYHFYDVDCCFELLSQGYDVGVIDVLVKHESEGPLGGSWLENRLKLIEKWNERNIQFPVTKNQFS